MQRSAFITGITGQDGSYLAEFLLRLGYEVHGAIRAESDLCRIQHIQQRIKLHSVNLLDQAEVTIAVDRIRPNEIYNLAANSFIPASWENPAHTANVNGLTCLRLLEAIRRIDGSIRFYQAGSSEMFGNVETTPQDEQTRFCPRNPYAVSKVFAYQTTSNYREHHNLYACTGILYNHESPRRPSSFVSRKITMAAARIKLGLQKELRLGNLDVMRDWGFAGDYVQSMWMMLNQEAPRDFVIGTGKKHSVRDFVTMAFDHVGLDANDYVVVDPEFYRPSEKTILVADPSNASQVLGWTAKTSLRKLIAGMVDHDLQLAGEVETTFPIKAITQAAA
jgi:GDPmannose 4,6-dehydratase